MATAEQRKSKEAEKQLRTKLKLERELYHKMRRFFARQTKEFLRLHNDLGLTMNADILKEDLVEILRKHYIKTTNKFVPLLLDDINRELGKIDEQLTISQKAAIASMLLRFVDRETALTVTRVTNTSNKHIRQALNNNGDDYDLAAKELRGKSHGRSITISMTETQKAAEGAKQETTETAERVITTGIVGAALLTSKKEWRTREDKRVRDDHVLANRQQQSTTEPYLVGGELLMYPGDQSLGASIGNTINCRCNSIQLFSLL